MSLNVGELVATLTVDDSRFTRSIADNTRQMSAFEQTVRQATSRVDTSFRDSVQSADRLGTSARDAARDVGRVGTSANDVGRVGTEARQAERQVDNLGRTSRRAADEARNIGSALSDSADTAGSAGGEAGGSFLAGFTDKVGKLGGAAGPIATSLAGAAALGLAAGAVLVNAIQDGMEREAQLDLIQAKLGINEETAKKIGSAAGASYTSGWGESIEANMDAARIAIQSGLLTGEEDTGTFKGTIDQLNILSTLLDTDVSESVRAVSALMSNDLAANGTEAFDLIARAGEGSANKAGDLIDSVSEYSSGWKNAGLSAEYALALIQQSTDNGADNSDRAADSLREFGRRVTENGDDIIEAIDNIGLSGADMYAAFKKGGPDAEAAFDAVFDKIRSIEDPVERNQAAMTLLGDTAGDFIGTLSSWDPSKAVQAFGNVEGAAAKAGDTMSSNTAASFESAKRSVETSVDDIKLALAQGFGPALTDAANWVTTHKPEIIAFFTDLADAGFQTLDGFLAFTSGSLRAFGMLMDGIADVSSDGLNALGALAEGVGGVIKYVPGMQDTGKALESIGSGMQTMSDRMDSAGDTARSWADTIDETVRPSVRGIGEDVVAAGRDAEDSTRLMQALGNSVVKDIPDNKTIVIESNSPEQKEQLEALGLKVTTLPDGSFVVTSNTDEGTRILNKFIGDYDGRTITMNVHTRALNPMPGVTIPQPGSSGGRSYDGTIVGGLATRADGAFTPKNTQAHIQRTQATVYGEPETEGESYIPHAPSKRERSMSILTETARKFGFGLVREFADGGIVDGMTSWVGHVAPGMQMTSGLRYTDNGHHSTGQAADFSNGTSNTDEMLALANAIADRYPDSLELIYDDPRFNRQIKNGEFVGRDFYANAGDHTNHVHWARAQAPSLMDSDTDFPISTQGSVDPNSKQGIANTIIAEGRKRGMSQKQIKAALMAGLAETDLQNLDYGMDGDNAGILQQRSVGWGSLEDRKDPATAVGMFYDKLAKLDENSMTEAQLAQEVQQSGTEDGSNYAAKAAEAEALLASSSASTASPSTASGVTDTGVAMSTDGQRVYVTNWPATLGGGQAEKPADERVPVLTAGLKVFANGGIEDHTALNRPGPDGDFVQATSRSEAAVELF